MNAIRRASGRFDGYIQQHDAKDELLPLVHTTTAYNFDQILEESTLGPSDCDVFMERLLYMFYGRPAYRVKESRNERLEFEWPVVLIFKPIAIQSIKRIFPFDSGAFDRGVYEEFFAKQSKIDDFAVTPNLDSARKVVSAFYSNNMEYITGGTRKNVEIGRRQFEVQGVYELMRLPGVMMLDGSNRVRDDRSTAIEIQVDQEIVFKDNLIAVIIPRTYLDDDEILKVLKEWNVEHIKTYSTINNVPGETWVGQLYARTIDLYTELELLEQGQSK